MLTDTKCKSAKFKDKPVKLYDEDGLYLHIKKAGKYWRWEFTLNGQRSTHSMGVYPKVSLKEAREKHSRAVAWVEQGLNPNIQKKLGAVLSSGDTFQVLAEQWLNQHDITDSSKTDIRLRFTKDVYPLIGAKAVSAIRRRDIMQIIQQINSRGSYDVANRVTRSISQVLRYCMMYEICETDVTVGLEGAIKRKRQTKHYPAITDPTEFGQLLRDIDGYSKNILVNLCLRIGAHVVLRPTELREGRWSEIDWDKALWTIPAARMKKDREHVVPLTPQTVELLKELYKYTGQGDLMFPSHSKPNQAISPNTMNVALKNLGYQSKHSPHGFRSSFSTMANIAGKNPDLIEEMLSHLDKDRTRAAYMRGTRLEDRADLMAWWSDYLDSLK